MPRSRTPKAKAEITGTANRNPARFAGRNDPSSSPLGEPSTHLEGHAREAWLSFVAELPWLVESDRSLLEIAAELRGKLRADPVAGVNLLQTYSAVLSKLGATPADRSRITMPNDEDERDEFFDPPARSH